MSVVLFCSVSLRMASLCVFNALLSVLREQRQLLEKCAATAMNSKLIAGQKDFFSKMVVDAVMSLDELLSLKMIGIKKVQGGGLEVGVSGPLGKQ